MAVVKLRRGLGSGVGVDRETFTWEVKALVPGVAMGVATLEGRSSRMVVVMRRLLWVVGRSAKKKSSPSSWPFATVLLLAALHAPALQAAPALAAAAQEQVKAAATGDAPVAAHPPGAAIASAHALATQAGIDTLRAGGQLVLFPSWVLHDVKPFEGEGERITVAFNCWFGTKQPI